jgi:hypothetical protein
MVSTGVSAEVGRSRQTSSKRGSVSAAVSQAQMLATVRGLGIEAEDLPGFVAVFVLMLAMVDAGVTSALLPLRVQLLPGLGILTEVVVSYILAFVLYRLGELWDMAIDGRTWRWLRVLPYADDLERDRLEAQERLGVQHGLYDAAVKLIDRSQRSDLLEQVEVSRARSRLCRTLILPVLLISGVCMVAPDWNVNLVGLAALGVVLALVVAFAKERVNHVHQVYAAVGDL